MHMSPISSSTSLIAHGDGLYRLLLRYEKNPMVTAIFVCYSKHSRFVVCPVEQTFTVNSRSVEQTEQMLNQTFSMFVGLNGAQI